jgi:hypothetical protein
LFIKVQIAKNVHNGSELKTDRRKQAELYSAKISRSGRRFIQRCRLQAAEECRYINTTKEEGGCQLDDIDRKYCCSDG